MPFFLITLDNPNIPPAEFEADTEEEARLKAQAAIDAVAETIPETPPEIITVEELA